MRHTLYIYNVFDDAAQLCSLSQQSRLTLILLLLLLLPLWLHYLSIQQALAPLLLLDPVPEVQIAKWCDSNSCL